MIRVTCAFVLSLLVPAVAIADSSWLGWFHADLRKTQNQLSQARARRAAFGEPVIGNTAPQLGYQHTQVPVHPADPPWVQIDLGQTQALDSVVLIPAMVDFQPVNQVAYGFPRRFRIDASNDPTFRSATPLLERITEDFPVPSVAPVAIATRGVTARYVRVTVTRLAEANGLYFFALAEIMALRGNRNVAVDARVTASNTVGIQQRWNLRFLTDGRTPLGPPIRSSVRPKFDALFAQAGADGSPAWMAVDLGDERVLDEIRLHPLHSWQGADVPGFAFPVQFRVEISSMEDFSDGKVVFDHRGEDFPNPGNNPVTIRAEGQRARFVRVAATKYYASGSTQRFALSELEVQAEGRMISLGCRALSSGDVARFETRPVSLLTDGSTSLGELVELPAWLDRWNERAALDREIASLDARLPRLQQGAERVLAWTAGGVLLGSIGLVTALSLHYRRLRRKERAAFRTRLAQDLHDEIGSNLAGIAVLAETAALRSTQAPAELPEIQRVANETADAMREVLWLVGSRQVGGIDLSTHFRRVAERLLPKATVTWTELPESLAQTWPSDQRRELFLFFKEAITNIARHSQATAVEIAITTDDTSLELRLRDNGRGFDPVHARSGFGLQSLRARADSLGGSLRIESAANAGTLIVLQAPVPKTKKHRHGLDLDH